MLNNLGKHGAEFMRSLRNHSYEEVGDGRLFFPEQKAYLGGVFGISRNHGPMEFTDNLVVDAARNYGLAAMLLGGSQFNAWFVIPFATNTAVPDNLTSANFNTILTEFTNYTETVRQAWVGVAADSIITNSASLAVITIGTGIQSAVYGAGLTSLQAKGGSTGLVFCASLASTAKTGLQAGETLSFTYGISAASS